MIRCTNFLTIYWLQPSNRNIWWHFSSSLYKKNLIQRGKVDLPSKYASISQPRIVHFASAGTQRAKSYSNFPTLKQLCRLEKSYLDS